MAIEHVLVAAVGGCVSAIVHLYMRQERKHAAAERRLDQCESDRDELWKRVADLSRAVGRNEGGNENEK